MSFDDMIEYRLAIERLANTQSNYSFTNSGEDHARVVMTNIFRTSKNTIKIFAGDLNGAVSKDEYLNELDKYLTQGGFLTVLLEKDNSSPAIDIIKKHLKTNVSIAVVSAESLEKTKVNNKNNHFTIGDDRMFRFETDTEAYTAVCNFNDPAVCEKLNSIFNILAISSTPLN